MPWFGLQQVKIKGKFRFSTLGYKDKIAKFEADAEKDKLEMDEISEIRDNASSRDRDTDNRGRAMDDDDDPKDTDDQDGSDDDDSDSDDSDTK